MKKYEVKYTLAELEEYVKEHPDLPDQALADIIAWNISFDDYCLMKGSKGYGKARMLKERIFGHI